MTRKHNSTCDYSDVFFYEETTPLEELLRISQETMTLKKELLKTDSPKMQHNLFQLLFSLGRGLIRFGIYGEGVKCFEEASTLISKYALQPFAFEKNAFFMLSNLPREFISIMHTLSAFYISSGQREKLNHIIKSNVFVQRNEEFSQWLGLIVRMEFIRMKCFELRKKDAFKNLIGMSEEWLCLLDSIQKLTKSGESVLITGPSGVGKELVARALHEESGRKTFVPINCAAIPEGLINSELFGAEKGAYTGAVNRQIGLCETAKDGTLFLDEIGISSPNLQKALLRIIQEKEFMRVGGRDPIKFTGRIIAATNRDIPSLIKKGVFLEDLYWRLNVHEITILPLSRRPLDINELIFHFMTSSDIKKKISHEAVRTISDYFEQREVDQAFREHINRNMPDSKKAPDFLEMIGIDPDDPVENNVRELKTYITRLLYECDDDTIMIKDLPFHIAKAKANALPLSEFYRIPSSAASPKCPKTDIEKALLLTNGNQSMVAPLFGCTPQAINHKVKKYHLFESNNKEA